MLMHYGCVAEHQALFEKLINGTSTADRKAAAQEVTDQMLSGGAASFKVCVGIFCTTPCACPADVMPMHYCMCSCVLKSRLFKVWFVL